LDDAAAAASAPVVVDVAVDDDDDDDCELEDTIEEIGALEEDDDDDDDDDNDDNIADVEVPEPVPVFAVALVVEADVEVEVEDDGTTADSVIMQVGALDDGFRPEDDDDAEAAAEFPLAAEMGCMGCGSTFVGVIIFGNLGQNDDCASLLLLFPFFFLDLSLRVVFL